MNTRKWLLSLIGVATVIAVCFIFFKNNNAPMSASKSSATKCITNEENARTALNEIGQFLTKSYEIIDCIDQELNLVHESTADSAATFQKAKDAIAQTSGQLAAGESSIGDRLKAIEGQIDQLAIEDDAKTAFKETIQDFNDQQENLITYIHSVQEKISLMQERV